MINLKVKVTTIEELLGTASADPTIYDTFIGSKAPDAVTRQEELEQISVEEYCDKTMTVFPRKNGKPIAWDYQWKGFFKDACGMLRKVEGSECAKIKAYKKEIDGLIFVYPRAIPIEFQGEMGVCQRPLRGQTAQGERIALASSEAIPAGATMTFTISCLCKQHVKAVLEMLDYGIMRGFGQWRNSGKGRFGYELLGKTEEAMDVGNVIEE